MSSSDLGFSWKVKDWTSEQMKLKLDFVSPLSISSTGLPDVLRVSFENENFFYDQNDLEIDQGTVIEKVIPTQFPSKNEKEAVETTLLILTSSSSTIVTVNIVLSFLITMSLQYLWDMINSQ